MLVGAFLLMYMCLTWHVNPYLVGAALTLLGFPSVAGAIMNARRQEEDDEEDESTTRSRSQSRSPLRSPE
jgi:hypothetical protein